MGSTADRLLHRHLRRSRLRSLTRPGFDAAWVSLPRSSSIASRGKKLTKTIITGRRCSPLSGADAAGKAEFALDLPCRRFRLYCGSWRVPLAFWFLIATGNFGTTFFAATPTPYQQMPNPATRKFLPDQAVMDAAARDFAMWRARRHRRSPLLLLRQRHGRRRCRMAATSSRRPAARGRSTTRPAPRSPR